MTSPLLTDGGRRILTTTGSSALTAGSRATPNGEAKLKGTISNRRAPGSQRVHCGVAGWMASAGDREGTNRELGQCTCQRTVAYLNLQRLRPLIPAAISVFGPSTLLALQYYSVAPSSERPPQAGSLLPSTPPVHLISSPAPPPSGGRALTLHATAGKTPHRPTSRPMFFISTAINPLTRIEVRA